MGGKGLRVRLGSGGMKVIIFKGGVFFGLGLCFLEGGMRRRRFWRFFLKFFIDVFGFFLRELLNLCLSKF